jgi:hypothetical protein
MSKINLKQKTIISIAIIILLGFGMLISDKFQNKAKADSNGSTLYFNPSTTSVNINSDFTLDLMVDPGDNQVTTVETTITYDKTKFRLDSIDVNTNSSDSNFKIPLSADVSTAHVAVGVNIPPAPTVTEITKFATLHFHSLAGVSDSAISFSGDSMVGILNDYENYDATLNPASVTVNARIFTISDFANLVSHWLETGAGLAADVDADGKVNSKDLGIMMSSWSN